MLRTALPSWPRFPESANNKMNSISRTNHNQRTKHRRSLHCRSLIVLLCLLSAAAVPALPQTQIDLRTQAKQVDFSAASHTKPFKTGTSLPLTCTAGEAYFRTDATAGQNLYGCTSANSWTLQSGGAVINSAGGNSYTATFSSLTAVTIPGATHHLASNSLFVVCYDLSTPARLVEPDSITVNSGTFDVAINFAVAQSGSCLLTGSSAGAPGGAFDSTVANSTLRTLDVLRNTPSTLVIGSQCNASAPCNVRFGSTVYGFTASATVTLTAGTGSAYLYAARDGSLGVVHNLNGLTCANCNANTGVPAFPPDSIPLATWTATGGAWDDTGGIDRRAFLSTKSITSGPGLLLSDNGVVANVSIDTALVPQFLTASATLTAPLTATGTCAADLTLTLPGALAGDSIAPGWPASLPSGFSGVMRVIAADTVAVRLCNLTGSAAAIPASTYRATVLRSF